MKKLLPLFLVIWVAMPLHAKELEYGIITLSANAQTEVENDELYVSLQVYEDGLNTGQLTDLVNTKTALILDTLKAFPSIDAKTTQYNTRPIYRDGKIKQWQVTQNLSLKTTEFDQMSEFIGALDNLANIQSMQFRISRSQSEQTKASLTHTAITKFKAKAKLIAQALGEENYAIVSMNVDNAYVPSPQPMYERSSKLMADGLGAPAALQGGSNQLSVNVSGSIQIPVSAP
jgi:predicted secreted protein